ncbi:MAG: hypothetical protein IKJ91_07320 [Clostridia bacterium]|nr:hypothetical protein [Clostridia bacterium]
MSYTKIAKAKPFDGVPKINLAPFFGASPKKQIILRIPVTGKRPMKYFAENLPSGLSLSENIISGIIEEEGKYEVILRAENDLGSCEKKIIFEIAPQNLLISPLLGFTTWNAFYSEVTQSDVEHTAEKLCELGLSEYGYSYVNLDSGWQYKYGGKYDAIMPNPKFSDMKSMTDKVHSLGLKCGIYSSPMLTAWGCPKEYESIPGCTKGEPDIRFASTMGGIGTIRKERNNALQWAEWGFDYLKYDWKPNDTVNAEYMRSELIKTDRDIPMCVTVEAPKEYCEYWSRFCCSYRANWDSDGTWQRLMHFLDRYYRFCETPTRGHYFDLDMLDIGHKRDGSIRHSFTDDEQIMVYSLRAFLGSPIQISAVLDHIDDFEMDIYCNDEIIAINQDSWFSRAMPYMKDETNGGILHVFEKTMSDGRYAYAFFNTGDTKNKFTAVFETETDIRDVWAKEDVSKTDRFVIENMPHTVKIFLFSAPISDNISENISEENAK